MIAFTFWVISGPCTGESFVRSNIYIREILEREVYCACMLSCMRVSEASVFVLRRVVTLVCFEDPSPQLSQPVTTTLPSSEECIIFNPVQYTPPHLRFIL